MNTSVPHICIITGCVFHYTASVYVYNQGQGPHQLLLAMAGVKFSKAGLISRNYSGFQLHLSLPYCICKCVC